MAKRIDMQQSSIPTPQSQQSIFVDYFHILRRQKWVVLLSLIFISVPTAVITYIMTPVYEATSTIIYEEPKDTMFALDMGQPFYNKSAIINLREQITSRTLAEEVAKALSERAMNAFKFPDPIPSNFSKQKFIARNLRKNITVEMVRGGDILIIKVEANDPLAAKMIADTYVERLTEWNLKKKREEITNVRDFVEKQVSVFRDKIKSSDEALKNFKEENQLVSLSEASTEIVRRITEAEIAYNQAKAEREGIEQRLKYIQQKRNEYLPFAESKNSLESQQLKEQLIKLEMQYSQLKLKELDPGNSELISLEQKISKIKDKLTKELFKFAQRDNVVDAFSQIRNLLQESISLEIDLETYKARERAMRKIIEDYNRDLLTLPKHELEFARLIRDKEVNDKIYSLLLEKREEARITEASKVGDIHIIDKAEIPISPIKPQKKRNLALGILLGIGFGVGLAFFLNSLDTSIKSQEDLEKCVELPVLATIPSLSTNGMIQKMRRKDNTKRFYSDRLLLGALKKPHIFEAYRSLQLNFSFLNPDRNLKSLLVTSAGAGEGKTLTAVNIAQLYAQTGAKTLIIDCDLRRPMVHKAINIKQEPGLTNLLINKEMDLESYIQICENGNLEVLTSGTLPPNPSELLSSKRLNDILADVKNKYNFIILDAPPVISVTDSIILGTKVDGVLLVVRSGKTSNDAAMKAKKLLENSKINIAGAVLNDVDLKDTYGYYKDYYYYSKNKA